MSYSDIRILASQLDLSNFEEDSKRFEILMKQLHPNGCNLREEKYNVGEYHYLKIPLIAYTFVNEMARKYHDLELAHALFLRLANLYVSRN